MYVVQKLLWDMRHGPSLAARFRAEPDSVLDEYDIQGGERESLRTFDLRDLYDRGANPYLLYFCALQVGVSRPDYYARIRGEQR